MLKSYKHIAILLSLIWGINVIYQAFDMSDIGATISLEHDGEEKSEKTEENKEKKEYLINDVHSNFLMLEEIKYGIQLFPYSSPTTAIHDIPPEYSQA